MQYSHFRHMPPSVSTQTYGEQERKFADIFTKSRCVQTILQNFTKLAVETGGTLKKLYGQVCFHFCPLVILRIQFLRDNLYFYLGLELQLFKIPARNAQQFCVSGNTRLNFRIYNYNCDVNTRSTPQKYAIYAMPYLKNNVFL